MNCNIHFIDLGLPSGTLWADRNIGADSPEAFGDYFRFGETVPFTLDSPKYKLENFGKDIANTIYDSAMICLGVNFKIPSQYQANELMDFCQWERKILGGNYVSEFIGPNGNKLYLPYAGCKDPDGILFHEINSCGSYWCSRSEFASCGYASCFFFTEYSMDDGSHKCAGGLPVRPVKAIINKTLIFLPDGLNWNKEERI